MPSPFLEALRADMRMRGFTLKTEQTYLLWITKYIRFIRCRHSSYGNFRLSYAPGR